MDRGEAASEPLDLGVVGPAEPGDQTLTPDRTARRRPPAWLVLTAVFLLGAIVGGVVVQARGDAADYAEARVVGGPVVPLLTQPGARLTGMVELNLLNAGEHRIEILHIEADGITPTAGNAPDPVTVEPGDWGRFVQDGFAADCDGPPPGGLRALVRTADGAERLVDVATPPGSGAADLWVWACRAALDHGDLG
ncbi:hypothetical protein [Jiangella mangrovi]|uniref:Uncharacterized protein n=1 Tax=Jiangella mangrovi TaxID=1524084 RepID=A0A7W9GYE1_9ACTN|nr:hypothetical protein [Jiangella mangrovi]MBB5791946.1 hypothetical protein [Jiangella mangrovi]